MVLPPENVVSFEINGLEWDRMEEEHTNALRTTLQELIAWSAGVDASSVDVYLSAGSVFVEALVSDVEHDVLKSRLAAGLTTANIMAAVRGVPNIASAATHSSYASIVVTASPVVWSNTGSDTSQTMDIYLVLGFVGLAVLAALGVGGCLLFFYTRMKRLRGYSVDGDSQDVLQEWRKCVHEVPPGICVFCGNNPIAFEGQVAQHGPNTRFRCCNLCADLLRPELLGSTNQGQIGSHLYNSNVSQLWR